MEVEARFLDRVSPENRFNLGQVVDVVPGCQGGVEAPGNGALDAAHERQAELGIVHVGRPTVDLYANSQ